MTIHVDRAFAPLDRHDDLQRIGGGNETEVYCTDDGRYVVKLKHEAGQSLAEALTQARLLRRTAAELVAWLGPHHSIPSYYYLARDSAGAVQVVVVQPYLAHAHPLFQLDYPTLAATKRATMVTQLTWLVARSIAMHRATGQMPDLYGRRSTSKAERQQLNTLTRLPWRLWHFLIKRNLLRSQNLLLTEGPDPRIVLVDYDPVRRSDLYRWVYYTMRRVLFWRDRLLIARLRHRA